MYDRLLALLIQTVHGAVIFPVYLAVLCSARTLSLGRVAF